jgi:hypothetical protein
VFHYRGPGFWFGLPLGSQAGFALTAAILLAILTYMTKDEPNRRIDRWIDHPHLVSLVTYNAQILWLAIVAVVLGADEIGGSALLIWVPAAAMTAVLWSILRTLPAVSDPAAPDLVSGSVPPDEPARPKVHT